MIVPTVILAGKDGVVKIYNLSQFVAFSKIADDHVKVTFADGACETFFNEDAERVRNAIGFLHNTYQANAKLLAQATAKAESSLIVPATNGGPH